MSIVTYPNGVGLLCDLNCNAIGGHPIINDTCYAKRACKELHNIHANMADLLQFFDSSSLVTWLALIAGLLVFLYWQGLYHYNAILGGSPLPGPKPWPWVGNLLDVFKYDGIHKMLLEYFHKYGRVYKICIGRTPSIVVCDPEIVKQVMVKEFSKFPNRPPFVKPVPPFDSGLFVARDEPWKRIRTTLTPTFTAAKLKQIVPLIENASDALINKMQKFAETGKRCFCCSCDVFVKGYATMLLGVFVN